MKYYQVNQTKEDKTDSTWEKRETSILVYKFQQDAQVTCASCWDLYTRILL